MKLAGEEWFSFGRDEAEFEPTGETLDLSFHIWIWAFDPKNETTDSHKLSHSMCC